jgi:hypothetical protein
MTVAPLGIMATASSAETAFILWAPVIMLRTAGRAFIRQVGAFETRSLDLYQGPALA